MADKSFINEQLDLLSTYNGISPKPQDYDEYWNRAMEELNNSMPGARLIEADFEVPGAECFELYFTGVKGASIHAKYIRPSASDKPHPALLMFHGYGDNSGDWWNKLCYVHLGYSVASIDVRGQGGLSEDNGVYKGTTLKGYIIRGLEGEPDNMYYRQVFLDTVQLSRIIKGFPEIDETNVSVMGSSQGGALALACAALDPEIKRIIAACPYLCDYRKSWEINKNNGSYEDIYWYFRTFDPGHDREEQIFTKLGYIDVQFLAPRIKGEVLMWTGLLDASCHPLTQFAAYNKIQSPKRVILYPEYFHEIPPKFGDIALKFLLEV